MKTDRKYRVVVTGAAGFIGSNLSDYLLAEGCTVIGVDNFSTGRPANIAHLLRHPRFRFIEASVEDWRGCPGPVDWILHFASPASPPSYQAMPIQTLCANAEGTHRLLDVAREKGARFLLASTSEVYGDPEVHPQVEKYRGNVSSTGPRSMYDEAKRYAEAMTLAYHRHLGVDVRIMRIFNTYGPRMAPDDGRVISNFVCQALKGMPLTVYGDGRQTRSFQYISDLLEATWRLMHVDYHEPVNVGNCDEVTILDVARTISSLMGEVPIVHRELPADDPTRRRPDTTLARRLLKWKPKVSLLEGLEKTIPHFQSELGVRTAAAEAST